MNLNCLYGFLHYRLESEELLSSKNNFSQVVTTNLAIRDKNENNKNSSFN